MRDVRLVLPLVLLSLALPAAAGVQVDWDQKASFAGYKTHAWRKGTPAKSELNQARIEKIVAAELAGKGITPVESSPDILVVTHASSEMRQELRVNDFGYAYGGGYYRGGYGYRDFTVQTFEYTVGTLIVDLVDAHTEKLVWRGEASDTIGDNPERLEKKVAKVVAKMFQKYPPPTK